MGSSRSQGPPHSKNKLLASLPKHDYEHVEPYLRDVPMTFKQILHKQGEKIRDVIFPGGAVCSLLRNMDDGRVVEIATVGGEGAVGSGFFQGEESLTESIVQVSNGSGYALPVEAFNSEMSEGGPFYHAITRFSHALLHQISQTAVCNALHSKEERGCRWLLMMHDRAGRGSFQLTDELLGMMIGVRRPTVTLVAGTLARAGLIEFRQGTITILNREGLEQAACECYSSVVQAYRRLLPEPHV